MTFQDWINLFMDFFYYAVDRIVFKVYDSYREEYKIMFSKPLGGSKNVFVYIANPADGP